MDWKEEQIAWFASDLVELGFITTKEDWDKFQEVLCDTVVAYFEERN